MLAAIDIGNTNSTFGIFSADSDRPVHTGNIQTDRHMTTDELAVKYHNLLGLWMPGRTADIRHVYICSVVPSLHYEFDHMFDKYYNIRPHFITNSDIPLSIDYDYPSEIGADRVVNAIAGVTDFPGENLIIVDFGTATTFDVVSAGGTYSGGLIMTGVMSSLRALEEKASKLPHIDLNIPARVVARNTVEGIRSGIINGNGAMVDELCRRIALEMEWGDSFRVIATGGLGKLIKSSSRLISIVDPHLTLKGIYHIWKGRNA